MTITKKYDGVYIDDSILKTLEKSDGIIFDCDGVLIDITKSYDQAIIKTTNYVLENVAGIANIIPVDSRIIDGFKSTGGFNDEVDLTYAAILSIFAAKKLEKIQHDFVFEVIHNSDSSGIQSVEKYIEKIVDISQIQKKLSYPGTHRESILYKIFDQIFYGPELYTKIFNQPSEFLQPGLIENDVVIFDNLLARKLKSKFSSKISIVTGRGKESVKFSLQELLYEFDLKNSAFLEDEPRCMAKPNPESLLRSITGMNCKNTVYVGDSMEDLIMAKKATQLGHHTTFCGVIGTSKEPEQKLELFELNGARLVLDSIHLLPKVLNLE
jgi:HAD superfamily hydrolase (TIGR01549 family)